MVQELTGSYTVLCRECRYLAPVPDGNTLRWNCPHRQAMIVEKNDGRIFTFQLGSHDTAV